MLIIHDNQFEKVSADKMHLKQINSLSLSLYLQLS